MTAKKNGTKGAAKKTATSGKKTAAADKKAPAKGSKAERKAAEQQRKLLASQVITERQAELIHRGLTLVEADLAKVRTSLEARRMHEGVREVDADLRTLRGDGITPGLIGRFAPQLDAFTAGAMDGEGAADAGGQIPLSEQASATEKLDDTTAGAGVADAAL